MCGLQHVVSPGDGVHAARFGRQRSGATTVMPRSRLTAVYVAVVLSLSGTLAAVAYAQECIDYADFLHWAGSVDTPGEARGVAVAGNHAYIARGSSGLQVIDISKAEVGSRTCCRPGVILSRKFPYAWSDGAGGSGRSVL